jgi:tetratricopeptide (TPR) repeat protein
MTLDADTTLPGLEPSVWHRFERVPGADRLAIVFSHIDEPKGRFSLYGTMQGVPAHRLFVNIPGNFWYLDGIPGFGRNVEETAATLRKAVAALAPAETVCVGVSMGGYAALLFGALLDVRAIAFGPETVLKLPDSRSSRFVGERPPSAWDDLAPLLARRPETLATAILSGESDLVDLHCIRRVAGMPGMRVRTLRGVGHEVPAALHRFDAFRPLVAGFIRDASLPAALPLEGHILSAGSAAEDLVEGRRLRLAGDAEGARRLLEGCIAAYPDSDAARDELGQIRLTARDFAGAEKHFRLALRLAPDISGYHDRLGRALSGAGRFAEAEAAHSQALSLTRGNAALHLHHGVALAGLGRTAEAAEAFQAALSFNPRAAEAHHRLGLLRAGQGDHAGAEACHRAAITASPRNAAFHHHLALALAAQGRVAEALLSHERAAEINPANPTLVRHLEAARALAGGQAAAA